MLDRQKARFRPTNATQQQQPIRAGRSLQFAARADLQARANIISPKTCDVYWTWQARSPAVTAQPSSNDRAIRANFDWTMADRRRQGNGARPIADQLPKRAKAVGLYAGSADFALPATLSPVPRIERPFDPPALLQLFYEADFRENRLKASSDYAQKPQDKDQNEQSSETDVHSILPYQLGYQTAGEALTFPSLPLRYNLLGIILPVRKPPDLLDFLTSGSK